MATKIMGLVVYNVT